MATKDNRQQTAEVLEAKLLERFGAERPFTVPEGEPFERAEASSPTDLAMDCGCRTCRLYRCWRHALREPLQGTINGCRGHSVHRRRSGLLYD